MVALRDDLVDRLEVGVALLSHHAGAKDAAETLGMDVEEEEEHEVGVGEELRQPPSREPVEIVVNVEYLLPSL